VRRPVSASRVLRTLGLARRPDDAACHTSLEVIQLLLDDALPPDRLAGVRRHLEMCRMCGLEVETYRAIKRSLGRRSRSDTAARDRLVTYARTLAGPDVTQ